MSAIALRSDILEEARVYARSYMRAGFPVFPLVSVKHGGKTPLHLPWIEKASHLTAVLDPTEIDRWCDAGWDGQIGLVPVGHVILDADDGEIGLAHLAELEALYGPLPQTRWQHTGKGAHFLYRQPHGYDIRAAKRGWHGKSIDVRAGWGGYIVGAPSAHASGLFYRWDDTTHPVAELPVLWCEALVGAHYEPPANPKIGDAGPNQATEWGLAALYAESDRVLASVEGSRNNTLCSATFKVGQVVGGGHLDRAKAEEVMCWAGRKVGLRMSEVEGVVSRALAAGIENPRYPT